MSNRWNKIMAMAVVWVSANWLAILGIDRHERVALEAEYDLRAGILSQFAPRHVDCELSDGTTYSAAYRLFMPEFTAKEKYPVLVYLHGSGGRGNENARQLRGLPSLLTNATNRSTHPCFLIVPQCPAEFDWTSYRQYVNGTDGQKAKDVILRMIEQTLEHPCADRHRIYLVGYSMGSFGTWELVADFPERFATAVPISGGSRTADPKQLAAVPVWAIHGSADKTCPVEDTQKIVAAIRDSGGTPKYTELKGVGHGAWKPAFSDSTEVLDLAVQAAQVELTILIKNHVAAGTFKPFVVIIVVSGFYSAEFTTPFKKRCLR